MSGAEDLTDRVVVVTGAASGIGAATAAALLGLGARVVAGDLRAESMSDLAEEWGDQVVRCAGDVGDPATADALIAAAVQAWGRVDSRRGQRRCRLFRRAWRRLRRTRSGA